MNEQSLAARAADVTERGGWTVVQCGLAELARQTWNTWRPDRAVGVEVVPVMAGALALTKGWVSTRFGVGTASALFGSLEAIPADQVLARTSRAGMAISGHGFVDDGGQVPPGSPVLITPVPLGVALSALNTVSADQSVQPGQPDQPGSSGGEEAEQVGAREHSNGFAVIDDEDGVGRLERLARG